MHQVEEQLLAHIRRHELLKPGDRLGVAVSGGIDSTALLRLLLELRFELGIVLSVVHFNHKLRGTQSDADEEFVRNLAREHDLEFHVDQADVAADAQEKGISVETAARELRYEFFRSLIRGGASAQKVAPPTPTTRSAGSEQALSRNGRDEWFNREKLEKIATGHTLDDQAETVLMRIIRGAGMRGLGAIYPRIQVDDQTDEHCGEIVRPLLETRRCELEAYLKDLDQSWREDATNADHHFTRNRVRRLLIPLLQREFNPSIAQSLTELAEIAREEEEYWQNEISGWMGTAVHWSEPEWVRGSQWQSQLVQIGSSSRQERQTRELNADPNLQERMAGVPWRVMNASIERVWLLSEPIAVQRRLVKAIGDHAGISLEFKHVEEILRFAAYGGPSGQELSLPSGWKFVRDPERLIFVTPDLRQAAGSRDYDYLLPVPGTVLVHELGSQFETQIVSADGYAGYNRHDLLDLKSLPAPLRLRNWRPGDRFWPAHTKSPKKIKELLHRRHASESDRPLWPVVQSGNEIVWMRGFAVPTRYQAKAGEEALRIVEAAVFGVPEQ